MRVLAIGDVVGKNGVAFLSSKLKDVKEEYKIDFVIANGENSAEGNGITPQSAEKIFDSGVNVITGGNHTFRRKEIFPLLNENNNILRPFNYPGYSTPGVGVKEVEIKGIKVCVINLIGVVFMECVNPPIQSIDRVLRKYMDSDIKILDFHAEATAEKLALAYYVDGRITAMFGTHTHVQTSDETILSGGMGYITDVGMTGAIESVLGVKKEISIKRMKNKIPIRFENAEGPCKMECVIFDINENSGKTEKINRLRITD